MREYWSMGSATSVMRCPPGRSREWPASVATKSNPRWRWCPSAPWAIGDEPADHGVLRELLGREVEDVRHGHRGVGPVGSATIKMRTRLLILNDALHPVRVPRGHESRTVGTGGGYSIRLVAGKGPARRALLAEVGVLEALPCHRAGLDHHNDHRPEG